MNLAVAELVQKSFKKIFKNVAEEFSNESGETIDINNVQLAIEYTDGVHKYVAYKKFTDGKVINLEDYMDVITAAIAGSSIDATMAQGGPRYAAELKEKLGREVSVNEVGVIMCYNNDELPKAVLMCSGKKQRIIDIKTEF